MRLTRFLVIVCLVMTVMATSNAQETPPPSLSLPNGTSVSWEGWLAGHGSTAVAFWASWLPEDQRDLGLLKEIRRAANERNLNFVVIALQEPIEKSREALTGSGLQWLHDRHGAMLKYLLVYQIPSVVIIHEDGRIAASLSFDAGALTQWNGSN